MDLLDRLTLDILTVTPQLMATDAVDLAGYQPGASTIQQQHMSKGVDQKHKQLAERTDEGHAPECLLKNGHGQSLVT